jgi:calcium-dependent protein kinase
MDEIMSKGKFSKKDTQIVMKQVLSCVSYLHSNNVIHRDIKPENILLEHDRKLGHVILADFGTAMSGTNKMPPKGKIGTIAFMAPEVYNEEVPYDEKCDVWSCGVMLYLLLTGRYPFDADDEKEVRHLINKESSHANEAKRSKLYKDIPEEAKNLVSKMLHNDPKERYKAKEALDDPWFKQYPLTDSEDTLVKGCLRNLLNFNAT